MSASEKINGLMPGYMDRVEAVGADYADAWLITTFRGAHAQIVAVVTEAERQVRESHEDDVDLELAAALDALDGALP